jgi:hypothetical protein
LRGKKPQGMPEALVRPVGLVRSAVRLCWRRPPRRRLSGLKCHRWTGCDVHMDERERSCYAGAPACGCLSVGSCRGERKVGAPMCPSSLKPGLGTTAGSRSQGGAFFQAFQPVVARGRPSAGGPPRRRQPARKTGPGAERQSPGSGEPGLCRRVKRKCALGQGRLHGGVFAGDAAECKAI